MQKLILSYVLSYLILLSITASAQQQLCTELERTKFMDNITHTITYSLLQKSGYKRTSLYNKDYKGYQITFSNGPNSFTFMRFGNKIILAVINVTKQEPLLSSVMQVGIKKEEALKKIGIIESHNCLKLYDATGFLNLDITFKNGSTSKLLFYSTID
jgi:hypothetical protein